MPRALAPAATAALVLAIAAAPLATARGEVAPRRRGRPQAVTPAAGSGPGAAAPAVATEAEPAASAAADETPAGNVAAEAAPAGSVAADEDSPPRRHKARKKRKHGAPDFRILGFAGSAEVRAAATAGALSGEGTLRARAATSGVEAAAAVAAERGRWRLELPMTAAHRQTFGASLVESRGGADLVAGWRRGPSLRLEVEAGLRGVWRPDWPDEYQPQPDGTLAGTDRRSHWDRRVGAEVAAIPLRHQHARAGWRYTLVDQDADPSFDAVDEPTHLVPGDRDEHAVDLSWRHFGHGWKLGGALAIERRHYFLQFARDAGTGLTHAPAGGAPPNPLYTEWSLEPSVEAELALGDGELDLSYGHELVDDVYQGYYSYTGYHPAVRLAWQLGPVELSARSDLRWRTYGEGSYAAGPGHPPLTYGDRRVDRRGSGALGLRVALGGGWAAVADASLLVRRTNFPDYQPGIFPASRDYDIHWSYETWSAAAGVEVRR